MQFSRSAAPVLGTATLGLGVLWNESSHPCPGARQPVFPGHMIWVSRSPQVLPVGSLTDPREPSASRQEGGRGPDKPQAGYGWAPEKGLRRPRKTPPAIHSTLALPS